MRRSPPDGNAVSGMYCSTRVHRRRPLTCAHTQACQILSFCLGCTAGVVGRFGGTGTAVASSREAVSRLQGMPLKVRSQNAGWMHVGHVEAVTLCPFRHLRHRAHGLRHPRKPRPSDRRATEVAKQSTHRLKKAVHWAQRKWWQTSSQPQWLGCQAFGWWKWLRPHLQVGVMRMRWQMRYRMWSWEREGRG